MGNIKLKHCPFCGAEGVIMNQYSRKQKGYFHFVKCVLCSAQSKAFFSPEEDESKDLLAVMAWNRRTDPDESKERQ